MALWPALYALGQWGDRRTTPGTRRAASTATSAAARSAPTGAATTCDRAPAAGRHRGQAGARRRPDPARRPGLGRAARAPPPAHAARGALRRPQAGPGIRHDRHMRILVLSDLHYRLPHYDWLLEAAADVDVVAIAGDLVDVVSPVPARGADRRASATTSAGSPSAPGSSPPRATTTSTGPAHHGEQVAGWLRRHGRTTCTSTASRVDVGDTRFTVCPWWDGPVTRDEVAAQLAAAAVDRPARWVWLYHAPPAGTPLCHDGRRDFPDHDLAAWIAEHQPDVVLCGHIHQAPWAEGGSWHARLGGRGSSTPASRSARCRRTSPSTPKPGRPHGSASSSQRRSSSCEWSPSGSRAEPGEAEGPGGGPGCRGSGRPSRGGRRRRRTAA